MKKKAQKTVKKVEINSNIAQASRENIPTGKGGAPIDTFEKALALRFRVPFDIFVTSPQTGKGSFVKIVTWRDYTTLLAKNSRQEIIVEGGLEYALISTIMAQVGMIQGAE